MNSGEAPHHMGIRSGILRSNTARTRSLDVMIAFPFCVPFLV